MLSAQSRFGRFGWLAVLSTMVLALVACGGDDGSGDSATGDAVAPSVGETTGFPRPSGRSLRTLIAGMRRGPELVPSVSLLEQGRNRFGFALFDRGDRQIGDLEAALYIARGLDEPARGPFPAHYERIEVEPAFRSRRAAGDRDSARSVYVGEIRFPAAGGYAVVGVAKLDQRFIATGTAQVTVSEGSRVPSVGERAIRVHTPTRESVGGDIAKIETRKPPDTMHEIDLADALDEGRPVVLLFATAVCRLRVCGRVIDVVEEVKAEFADRVAFIHVEPDNGNDPRNGRRSQVRAWGLRTEPFLFAIDSDGVVAARLEGAFSRREVRAAVRRALR